MTTSKNFYSKLSQHDSGYFECQCDVICETEKAICFNSYNGSLDKIRETWIPKSQMEIIDLGKESGVRYFIKNWLSSKF